MLDGRAFCLAALYVGLGTIAVCSVNPSDPFHGAWSLLAPLATFPVSIVSFTYRFAQEEPLYPVFRIQTAFFIATYFFIRQRRQRKRNR
jgi:hypothetical protein